jgi:general secretion pathway protein M
MSVQLSLSRQALVAVAAFIGLLVTIIVWGGVSLVTLRDLQTEFETKSETLDILKRQPVPQLSRGENAGQTAARAAVISASTETVAASELHKAILASLDRAGGTVHSIQAEATTDVTDEGLRRLNAQVTFDGSISALQKVLFDLETSIPFIFVDSLLVQPTATATSDTKPAEMLRVSLVASSYWKAAATESH